MNSTHSAANGYLLTHFHFACAETRDARRGCLIPGCPSAAKRHFCRDHWFALPAPLRRRWWMETDYGKEEPNEDLRAAVLYYGRLQRDFSA